MPTNANTPKRTGRPLLPSLRPTPHKKRSPQSYLIKYNRMQAAVVKRTGCTPLDFFLAVMRKDARKLAELGVPMKDCTTTNRMYAASAAMPYCHRKMPVAIDGGEGKPLFSPSALHSLPEEELKLLVSALNKAKHGRGNDITDIEPVRETTMMDEEA